MKESEKKNAFRLSADFIIAQTATVCKMPFFLQQDIL